MYKENIYIYIFVNKYKYIYIYIIYIYIYICICNLDMTPSGPFFVLCALLLRPLILGMP